MKVLITGGAGFIGRRVAATLQAQGHTLTVLDNFSPQIHDVASVTEFKTMFGGTLIEADVRDRSVWAEALPGHDAVVHLAAETGTGQSMYEVQRYEAVNVGGTANMLDVLVNGGASTVRKIVLASSRAVYGEGQYHCQVHGDVQPVGRREEDLTARSFNPRCPVCGAFVVSKPTSEDCRFSPTSMYGLTKQVQEQMVLMFAAALSISGVALRYQNVYGPGQSLNNPYTGILAIFSNLAREGHPIQVFEDGLESRDFIYVDDVVRATCACLAEAVSGVHVLNVGSGIPTSVLEVARSIVDYFNSPSSITVTGAYRKGDIRHSVAELQAARRVLGFTASVPFAQGLRHFLDWAADNPVGKSAYGRSLDEMRGKGLLVG